MDQTRVKSFIKSAPSPLHTCLRKTTDFAVLLRRPTFATPFGVRDHKVIQISFATRPYPSNPHVSVCVFNGKKSENPGDKKNRIEIMELF
jgi:hypothetical protein